jgi:uncharacterized membrane protein YgcG
MAAQQGGQAPSGLVAFLQTRRGMSVAAWALLCAAAAFPTSHASAGAGWFTASTGLYAAGNLFAPERYPPSAYAILPRAVVFDLAFLTNLVFLFGIWFRDADPSRRFVAVLVAALAIDASVAFVLRDFATLPGYWLWLAAVAAMVWAFVARPATGAATRGYLRARLQAMRGSQEKRTGLPTIVGMWIGWVFFWGAISLVSHWVKPNDAAPATKAAALTGYVNDFARVLPGDAVENLATSLSQFERQTSIQLAVAVYARLPHDSLEEFTIRVAELSRLGRKGLDNGVILSIFAEEGRARLEVGYGLEPVLTDLEAHRILESVLAPAWRSGEREKAVGDTLGAVMATVRGAYESGRMPGRFAVFRRQFAVEVPKFAKAALPALTSLPTSARFAIAFFGTFLLLGIWDGFVQTRQLVRNAVRAIANLRSGQVLTRGTRPVQLGSIIDTLKVMVFLGFVVYCVVGIVIIAGGGAFGGGGASLRL